MKRSEWAKAAKKARRARTCPKCRHVSGNIEPWSLKRMILRSKASSEVGHHDILELLGPQRIVTAVRCPKCKHRWAFTIMGGSLIGE